METTRVPYFRRLHRLMRQPLRLQLLVPMLLVVIGAIVGVSLLSANLAAREARRRQEENLQRVVATLTEAAFPLNESVLKRMSGLSGAEFVVFDASGVAGDRSRPFPGDDLRTLSDAPVDPRLADFSASRLLSVAGDWYLINKLRVTSRLRPEQSDALAVLYPVERWSVAQREAFYPPLVVGAIAACVVTLITAMLARRVVGPLEALRRQAAAVEQGRFQPMPLSPRNDEIQDLARSINHMVERLARYDADVRQNERLRTLGQLGAGIAHQMRNAATGARLALDLHGQACPLEPGCETLEVAGRQLTLIETYLRRFLTLGRQETLKLEPMELGQLVADVLPLVRPACQHARLALQHEPPARPLWIRGDSDSLMQLLVNLMLNAVDAAVSQPTSGDGGRIGAVGVAVQLQDDGRPTLCVTDTGPGPSGDMQSRLFEPFASDKPDGTGLGLAVVQQIATQHHAELTWRRAGERTEFLVTFPATCPTPPGVEGPAENNLAPAGAASSRL